MNPNRVVVLAVTKMLSGMCTGGIALASGKWVRPVKDHGIVLLGDLTYADKTVMRPFDVVDLPLTKPKPAPPHIEDWLCNFVKVRPVKVGHVIGKRLPFMERYSEPDGVPALLAGERSLLLFEPSDVEATFSMDGYSGKYDVRISTSETGERPLPVTDIKWRALGRMLLAGHDHLALRTEGVRDTLATERIFVALGLSRTHEGKHWPLVVGIHVWPDYDAEIDYSDL